MIKKITVSVIGFFLLILVFNACQSSGTDRTAIGAENKTLVKDFRDVLAAGDVEGTLDFLESNTSLTETDAYGEIPLFTAARYGHADLIALLLIKGADPKAVNVFGECPVHVAAANGKKDAVALLAPYSGAMDVKDGFGMTASEKAVENGFPELMDGFNSRVTLMKKIYKSVEKYGNNLPLAARYFAYSTFPAENREAEELWTAYVARSSKERLEGWLALEDKAFPQEISEPATPPPVKLTQEKWETNREFEDRARIATQERQKVIDELQEEFRMQVEERNMEVVTLKQIQGVRVSKLADYRSGFAQFAMEELFTGVGFKEASLDKETGDLFLDNVGFGTDNTGRFVVENAGKELRQAAFQAPESLKIKIVPFTDLSGGFGIKEITVLYGKESFTALPTVKTAGEQELLVASIDTSANYTVFHEGGKTEFSVNQQIGGSTWIYLGKFKFRKDENT